MITMKEWMELVDYKITEGSDYGWACYGPNSYSLSSWNGVHGTGGYSFDIVFSTKSQKVYEVSMSDYTNDRAYRMINPKVKDKYTAEAKSRGEMSDQAWDEVDYVDLEEDDDSNTLQQANTFGGIDSSDKALIKQRFFELSN